MTSDKINSKIRRWFKRKEAQYFNVGSVFPLDDKTTSDLYYVYFVKMVFQNAQKLFAYTEIVCTYFFQKQKYPLLLDFIVENTVMTSLIFCFNLKKCSLPCTDIKNFKILSAVNLY